MSTEKNLNNLVINKVESQEVYNYMKSNSLINEDELYLVEGTNDINIDEATEDQAGLMSASDKVKLNGIEDGANKTIVDSALSSMSTNPVQNQVINAKFDSIQASIDSKVDKVSGKGLSTNDLTATLKSNYDSAYTHSQQPHASADAEKNVIIGVQKNGADLTVNSSTRKVNITVPTKTSDLTNDSNFATVTDVNNAKITVDSTLSSTSTNPVQNSVVKAALDGKVDTEQGKGLSTNDLTDSLKSNYDVAYTHSQQPHAPANAEANVIVGIQKNGVDLTITNKKVNIVVPTKITDLTNDSNFATTTQLDTKVDKVTGKGLSTNDYTTEEKTKLNNIEDGANKTIVDAALNSTSTNPVQNKAINTKFDSMQSDIDSKVPSTRTVNGKALTANITLSASDVGALPNTTQIPSIDGLATETYVDNKVAGIVDSAPATLDTLNELAAALGDDPNFATTVATQIGTKVDKVEGKGLSANDYTDTEKSKLASIAEYAEVNQNAFSNVVINGTTISADNKTDSLTIVAGDNVTIVPDVNSDKITISSKDTVYTHPTYTARNEGLYKVTIDNTGHVSNASVVSKEDITGLGIPAQDTTYSEATTTISGLMSATDKAVLDSHVDNTDIHVTSEEKATWNAKADVPFKPAGKSYLTFSSTSSFTLAVKDATKHWNGTLEYFASDKIWTVWDGTTALTAVDNAGEYVLYLRGTGNTNIGYYDESNEIDDYVPWVINGEEVRCTGNIETLLDYATVESGQHPVMAEDCYGGLFMGCTALITPPELSATVLAVNCYNSMFRGCTSLTQAPSLPAITLSNYCYNDMFRDCTSLTKAPNLPAMVLGIACYAGMFRRCTSLTKAPVLPATTLSEYCYQNMFIGCISLIHPPELPATTLAKGCYINLFNDCTSLTQAPVLPATTLAVACYQHMFDGCTSLTKAPTLPAIQLESGCYWSMFQGCTKLKLSSTKTGEYVQEYRIPTSGDGTTATNALNEMFNSTGGTFTGTPSINTTYYLSTSNSIAGEEHLHIINEDIHVTANQKKAWNSSILVNPAMDILLPDSLKQNWYSIAYGKNGYMPYYVVLEYGVNSTTGAISNDGVTWEKINVPSGNWFDITYGEYGIKEGKFVAISSDNSDIAMYYDIYSGPGWTTTTLPVSASWQSVAFGGNKFVAVAYGTSIAAYSEDGITWNQTTLPSSNNWRSVTYGNGMFVAVAKGSSAVAYSSDGINWTASNLPVSADWISVTYGDNKFVAIAYNGTIAAYSNDGITWSKTTLPFPANWISVIYGCGGFVAIANGSNMAAFSSDGITWELRTLPLSKAWRAMTRGKVLVEDEWGAGYNKDIIIAIASDSSYVLWTDDNVTWSYQTTPKLQTISGIDVTEDIGQIIVPSSIAEQNKGLVQKFWRGTTAEYEAITTKSDDTMYIITDTEEIAQATYMPMNIYDPQGKAQDIFAYVDANANTKQDKPTSVAISLSASAWDSSALTQTVTVSGILADETAQLITPTPALASQTAYYGAGILCTGQATDSLTFTATSIPTVDLTVYVVIQGVAQG